MIKNANKSQLLIANYFPLSQLRHLQPLQQVFYLKNKDVIVFADR